MSNGDSRARLHLHFLDADAMPAEFSSQKHDRTMTQEEKDYNDNDEIVLLEAPPDYGLWISWEGGSARMEFVLDHSQTELHPHIHTPPLENVHIVKGGGSGATVFAGDMDHHQFIWKHGDHKDMRDVFALAEIEHELLERSEFAPEAVENIRSRIPRFAGIFISPAAFRVLPDELWSSLTRAIRIWNEAKAEGMALHNGLPRPVSRQDLSAEQFRRIKVLEGSEADVNVHRREVRIFLEGILEEKKVWCDYEATRRLVAAFVRLQAQHMWKFSVAQVAIGGATPRTASSLMISRGLRGDTLNELLNQFISVLQSLRAVTKPSEKEVLLEQVKDEVDRMSNDVSPADVSPSADMFVGSAIVKNWHPEKGRFKVAHDMAAGLRGEGSLILTPEEQLPANALGFVLRNFPASVSDVFVATSSHDKPFRERHSMWRDLLHDATHLKSKAATECVWTCGFTDAGLHNMFFSGGRLWLFDLGKPNYQPLPAFLTKFLMSFFHCLGMQDVPDGSSWVNRFRPSEVDGMLELTEETKELLPIAHEAYSFALDRLVAEVFDGEQAVRDIMIKYSVLQLMSDACFCLKKWQIKGGGAPSYGDGNHNKGLEKWLWRALWDIWVASEVKSTYVAEKLAT